MVFYVHWEVETGAQTALVPDTGTYLQQQSMLKDAKMTAIRCVSNEIISERMEHETE